MTEAEWVCSADPVAMVAYLRDATTPRRSRWQGWLAARRFSISERKWLLFYAACCRRVEALLPSPEGAAVVGLVERVADGLADVSVLSDAVRRFRIGLPLTRTWALCESHAFEALIRLPGGKQEGPRVLAEAAQASAWARVLPTEWDDHDLPGRVVVWRAEEAACQAGLLREVIGNPFRPCGCDPAWLAWQNGTVSALAARAAEDRSSDRLAVLADALEDAGCRDDDLLGHLRSPGPHCRGCWALDLLLARG